MRAFSGRLVWFSSSVLPQPPAPVSKLQLAVLIVDPLNSSDQINREKPGGAPPGGGCVPTAPHVNCSHVFATVRSETSGAQDARARSAETNLLVALPRSVKAPPAMSDHVNCSHVLIDGRSATSGAHVPRF